MKPESEPQRRHGHSTPHDSDLGNGWLPASWRCNPFERVMQHFGDLLSDDIFSRIAPNLTGKTSEEFLDALRFGSFQINGDLTGFWKGDPSTKCDLKPIFLAIAVEVGHLAGCDAAELSHAAQDLLFQGKLPLPNLRYGKTSADCVHLRSIRMHDD